MRRRYRTAGAVTSAAGQTVGPPDRDSRQTTRPRGGGRVPAMAPTKGSPLPVIEIDGLTKRYGDSLAVDHLSFTARAGAVTGFLGANGAGKTTTLRLLLGLAEPTAGTATVDGRVYADLDQPARRVGAVLEASSFHPGRRGRDHLRVLARAAGLPETRVDVALDQVGLAHAGRKRVKEYSLGMRQRLALAGALLGEPDVLILDEPTNGLDPEGVHWLRRFLRSFADGGGCALVSSHLLAEVAQTVDDVVIIARGKVVAAGPLHELVPDGADPFELERLFLELTTPKVVA